MRQIHNYFNKHPFYNATIHLLIGIGVGAFLTYPFFGIHPIRWGVVLIAIGLLGHFYPLMLKKG